ncbi:tetratricopeptide repeat protein [Parabacteroides sp. PH5-8]|uniref:tetratricopeptide repeat protein n=1 Tax=unclassified Parabacteroides TaxID=2649774 RepID=UPI0032AF72A0
MKKVLIPLCLTIFIFCAHGQRSYQFDVSSRLFTEGKELFYLKNYPGCIDKLQAYKQQVATDATLIQETDFLLAYAAFEQGRANSAELLKEYLNTYPDSRHTDEVNFLIGSAHFGRGEYEKAIFFFNDANIDMLSSEQQEAYSYRLAYSLLQTGDMEKARGYFMRIKQIGTTYREPASYYVAYIDYATKQYNEALVEFSRLKEVPAYREQSQYFITQIYFVQGRYDRAIKEGEELLTNYPNSENNSELYRVIGNSYYRLGDQKKAIAQLDKYVASTDKPLRGDLYILGVCYYNEGNYPNAIKYLGQTVTTEDALTQNAYLYLGQSYLKRNDKNNARMAFEAAATSSFDKQVKEAATYNYALLVHETAFTGFGESVTVFENFLNEFPDSQYADKVNDYLVEVYLTTKNYQSALTSIEKIKRPSTKILEAKQDILFQLGTQAFTNVKLDEAVSLFTRSIDMGAYNTESRNNAYFWRGESYYRQGAYTKAITDYRTYLNNTRQRNTDMYALAYYNLGYSYFKQQQYNDALTNFRQYVSQETNQRSESYADAYNRIGDCQFHNRQFAQAEESYNRAAAVLPSAGDYAVFQKGYVLGLQKNYTGKINAMDKLINDYPDSRYVPDALFEKGRSYVLLENSRSAVTAFESLMQRFPQNSLARKASVQLGLLYYNDNQPQKAAEAYKKVISAYPNSEEARVALQDLKSVYIDLNDINTYARYVNSLDGSVKIEISEQDSLTYIAAERLFMRGDYDGARRSLTTYLQNFPLGAFSSNANYYLASIAFNKKDYKEAKRLFTAVTQSGDTKFREDAWARKAEIEYLEKDYTAALESFKRLQLVAESPENREAAKLGVMRCAQYTNQWQDALIGANDLLKESKLSPEVKAEAQYVRAKAYISLNQESKALADLLEVSKDTRTAHGAEAKYLLAQLYYDTNEDKKAEDLLMNFIENGTPHQYWLARGFIVLADVYIRQGDDFQARQYLTSLQNNYKANDDIAGMIENRLAKLKK